MFPTYSADHLNSLLPLFGIHIHDNDTTDPVVMQKIMSELNLDMEKLTRTDATGLLKKLSSDNIPLQPLKERILLGIVNNPPLAQSMVEIAEEIQKQNINLSHLSPARQLQLQHFIYYLVILEVFVHLIANDKNEENMILKAIFNRRASKNPGSTFWNFINTFIHTRGDLFFTLKLISIDPGAFIHLCWRQYPPYPTWEQLEDFIKTNRLTGLNASALRVHLKKQLAGNKHNGILCGNILEALMTEDNLVFNRSLIKKIFKSHVYRQASKQASKNLAILTDNIKAGLALILYEERYEHTYSVQGFDESKVTPDVSTKTISSPSSFWEELYHYSTDHNMVGRIKKMPKEWVNLYESWNIAFVLRAYPRLFHIVLPKLLIPETLAINAEFYIATRVTSLWLTLNFMDTTIAKHLDQYPMLAVEKFLPILGKNNLTYAKEVLLKNEVNLDALYKEYIQQPNLLALYLRIINALNGGFIFAEDARKLD